MDDQPVWIRTRRGHILSVPYPHEVNDIPMICRRAMIGLGRAPRKRSGRAEAAIAERITEWEGRFPGR